MAPNESSEIISPIAATVPLTDEGYTTDGLSPDDPYRPGPETTRINRTEIDALLRSSQPPEQAPPPEATHQPQISERPQADGQPATNASQTSGYDTVAPPPPDYDRSRAGFDEGLESEDLTIAAARPRTPTDLTTGELEAAPGGPGPAARSAAVSRSRASAPATPARASRPRRFWLVAASSGIIILCATVAAVWLAVRYFRKPVTTDPIPVAAVPAGGPAQAAEEKVAEAEALLASGDMDGAIARLRDATTLDPSNIKAHRRLGDLLLETGARREAIEEYRAITRRDANDRAAWRALGSAQVAEGLYVDAAESYRRLLALTAEAEQDAGDLLSYADALRLSGRAEEARALYQKLSAAGNPEVARAARQHLAELALQASPTPAPSPEPARADSNQNRAPEGSQPPAASASPTPADARPTPPPSGTPAPALSASDHFNRGEQLWPSNRGAALAEFRAAANKGNRDAYYYLGLSIVEKRDPKGLNRAELLAALQYFQNARAGKFGAQAQRYEDQLGKEFDRRRNQ